GLVRPRRRRDRTPRDLPLAPDPPGRRGRHRARRGAGRRRRGLPRRARRRPPGDVPPPRGRGTGDDDAPRRRRPCPAAARGCRLLVARGGGPVPRAGPALPAPRARPRPVRRRLQRLLEARYRRARPPRAGGPGGPVRTVLVTGFGPFGEHTDNPSAQAVELLAGTWTPPDDVRLAVAVLPVSFERATTELRTLVERHRPAVVLGVGLAAGRERLGLERVAVNLVDARIPDVDGAQPADVPVRPGEPP